MKLLILRNNLVDGLAAIERAIGAGGNLPILKNAHLRASENKIVFTATNLELAVRAIVPGKIIDEGELTVPCGVFGTIVKNMNTDRIALESNGHALSITTDNYEATIQGSDAKEFPIIPTLRNIVGTLRMGVGAFLDALNSVVIAAQYSEIRPEISGVHLSQGEGQLTLVATDSFRLAERKLSGSEFSSDVETSYCIIPLRSIEEVSRVFTDRNEELSISSDQNQILFETPTKTIISRLIDGKFPEYQAIIPKSTQTTGAVDRAELLAALKLVSTFSGRGNDITVSVGENKKFIELSSADSAIGQNTYRVPIKLKGEKFSIVFNWKYLLDGVRVCRGSEVVFGVNQSGPVTITSAADSGLLYLLMPIKA
jgi:DNA polymerase-3 subunit beta